MVINPIYGLLIGLTLVSWLIQWRLRSKFSQYSHIALHSGLSGKQVAEMMLADNRIYDVKIISTEGQLSDHYNPADKTVNLSEEVYHGRSAMSAAVAAHEVGHAVQHATAYSMLQFRSAMVPALSAVSRFMPLLLLAGVFLLRYSILPLGLGVALFAFATLFSFVTLPVEFDASKRALAWMERRGIVSSQEHAIAKDGLRWAALTYVVAAISSLATLLHYASILFGGRRSS
ncbi:zinc metallopeptidase [Hymenobacter jeollabukensis]|uniref:Zinc metallopeptidase n=1 Tax=Hymenobacter jeollabukensis TaxID=2025313 RepID=A0A5R8WUT0_9BACT|nr:zinc metallopeptidase [Hymenobacter jeollabukensis]TLM95154.1 zinc metallopeptidase [Hymenobacter jeollabukensis]